MLCSKRPIDYVLWERASKAILLISDWIDNGSGHRSEETKEFWKASEVQVYAVGPPQLFRSQSFAGSNPFQRLNNIQSIPELCRLSGGRSVRPANLSQLRLILEGVHSGLKSQYVLGWVSSSIQGTKRLEEGRFSWSTCPKARS